MDARRFDGLVRVWATTRSRRGALGLLVAGAGAGLGALRPRPAVAACRERTERCRTDDQCCAGGRCRKGKCHCRAEGTRCSAPEQCCSQACDFLVGNGTCASCRGWFCQSNRDCCGGYACSSNRCDGCYHRGISCATDAQCCFSDCASLDGSVNKVCLSRAGGRCAHDPDCMTCYFDRTRCQGACVDGFCTV